MQLSFFEMVKKGVSTIIEVVDDFARKELVRLENLINNLATVARTGSYNDLIDKPVIPTPPELSEVAYTGEYDDLLNKPTLFSGNYNDLTNKPTLFSGNYNDLTDKPNLSAVATSGSYNDLSNRPTIPIINNVTASNANKLQLGNDAICYGYEIISPNISVQYGSMYYGDATIIIPPACRLSGVKSISITSANLAGLLTVNIVNVQPDTITIRFGNCMPGVINDIYLHYQMIGSN